MMIFFTKCILDFVYYCCLLDHTADPTTTTPTTTTPYTTTPYTIAFEFIHSFSKHCEG